MKLFARLRARYAKRGFPLPLGKCAWYFFDSGCAITSNAKDVVKLQKQLDDLKRALKAKQII